MSLLKGSQQIEISLQRAMPVDDIGNASIVKSVSGETVQLYYYNSGVLTVDAGQAAGTLVVGKLTYDNILSKIGDVIGTSSDTSFSLADANTFDDEVLFPYRDAELKDTDTGANKALEIKNSLTVNGQYCVDYRTGVIYGLKKNTGTTVSASYKYSSDSVTIETGDIQIGNVGILNEAETVINPATEETIASILASLPNIISAEFKSPSDFNAVYTSNVTITLSALPFTITDSSQIAYIKVVPTSGSAKVYINGLGGVTMKVDSNVITVSGAGTPFTIGDVYEVGINAQDKAFDLSTNSQMSSVLNPDSEKYVQDSLLDTTNVAAATNYFPSATGMSMDGFKDLSLTGKFIDADGTITLTIEATNDEDTTNADWKDVTTSFIDSNTGILTAAVTITNGTLIFALEKSNFNFSYFRVKMVNGGATNTCIIKARRKA